MKKKGRVDAAEKRVAAAATPAGLSFDSELDALFKAVGSSSQAPKSVLAASAGIKSSKKGRKTKSASQESLKASQESRPAEESQPVTRESVPQRVEDEEDVEELEEGDGDLSSIASDEVISGISDDESEEANEDSIELDTPNSLSGVVVTGSDEEEDDGIIPVHETILDPSLLQQNEEKQSRLKRKAASRVEPQADRDTRSLFIGNLPIQLATSRSMMKALKKHLVSCSPYPSVTAIDAIRLRSIPFSKPTDDYEARNPDEAEEKTKKRQRSLAYKEALNESSTQKRSFLSGSQKRKVAYINEEINDKADSVNAYVTLAKISPTAIEAFEEKHEKNLSNLTDPALTALLSASVNGTLFEERHLRADLVIPLLPADILETGLTTVKTADDSLLGASAGATSIDNESRKRTIFVGNLDFEAKEEELRGFFETLVTRERGPPPDVLALDFSNSERLPAAEETGENPVSRLASWVYGVRIIRDAATQMGKGFGYVRFLDAACVDEIMAIHESEQAALTAVKSGKPMTGDFRRKLKFKGRPLRVSRCKVSKGHVTATSVAGTPKETPKRPILSVPHRSRSSGAPTPDGSSPHLRKQQQQRAQESPSRKSLAKSTVPNPKPLHSDPLKTARNAQKRADADRQAKRLEKKNRKRAEKMRLADGGDKTKVKLKIGRGKSNFGKKVARLGSLAALAMVTLIATALIQPVQANNEIVNFGPILCRADAVGHLETSAARRVSKDWPVVPVSTKPKLASLNPALEPDGVWITLLINEESEEVKMAGSDEASTVQQLSSTAFPLLEREDEEKLSPRDRWLRNTLNKIRWTLTKRYTFRVTWAANFPIDVKAEVHSPRSMLAKGGIKWTANGEDITEVQQKDDLAGYEPASWPCPQLYLHITSKDFGVQIPERHDPEGKGLRGAVWKGVVRLSEAYMGSLIQQPKDLAASLRTPIPVHLLLEPLFLGVIPQTALSLLAVMLPLVAFSIFFILPRVSALLEDLIREEEHAKKE